MLNLIHNDYCIDSFARSLSRSSNDSPSVDLSTIADRFGISPEQVVAAASALLPAIVVGLRDMDQSGGLASIGAMAGSMGTPHEDIAGGNSILDEIFGSKEGSRAVTGQVAAQTGINEDVLKCLLSVVAGLIGQMVARNAQGAGQGGLSASIRRWSILGSFPGTSSTGSCIVR